VLRRRLGRQVAVRAAFLSGDGPSAGEALTELHRGGTERVVVLPLLLTPAYHTDTDLPALLADLRRPGLRVSYGQPLGPHPLLLAAAERRLAEAGGGMLRAGETAVVLAAAGSSRPEAAATVASVARAWQAARGWLSVTAAYASAARPAPAEAVRGMLAAGARSVVVATYLLAPGLFADRIRRCCLDAGAAAVSAPLGSAPEVADLIADRYAEAMGS
jgi:sirohydrochlorin ferrochelatase